MFTTEILEAIKQAAPDEKVKLLVEWDVKADLKEVASLPSTAERREKFNALQQQRSEALRNWLAQQNKFHASQISGSAITALEADKATWQGVVESDDTPLHADDVRLHLDQEVFLVQPIKD